MQKFRYQLLHHLLGQSGNGNHPDGKQYIIDLNSAQQIKKAPEEALVWGFSPQLRYFFKS
jgi:hypothetical protein